MERHVLFLGLLLGANVEGPGDNQENKFFIDNTAQALIPSGDIFNLPENKHVFPYPFRAFFKKIVNMAL